LTGYVIGNGLGVMTAVTSIPGADVSGNISGNAANVTGTVAVANGGTGAAATLTGYVKGNGIAAMSASATIPGADVSGDIAGNASNVTGVVAIANGGTGNIDAVGALNALLPIQTLSAGMVLSTNGASPSWVAQALDTNVTTTQIVGALAPLYITMAATAEANQQLNTDLPLTYDTSNFVLNSDKFNAVTRVDSPLVQAGALEITSTQLGGVTLTNKNNTSPHSGAAEFITIIPSQNEATGTLNVVGNLHVKSTNTGNLIGNIVTDGSLTINGQFAKFGASNNIFNSFDVFSNTFTTTSSLTINVPAASPTNGVGLYVTQPVNGINASLAYNDANGAWNTNVDLLLNGGMGILYGNIVGNAGVGFANNLQLANTPDALNLSATVINMGLGMGYVDLDITAGAYLTLQLVDGVDITNGFNITNNGTAGWIPHSVYEMNLIIKQPAVSTISLTGVKITWPPRFHFANGGVAPVLSTGNGAVDILKFITYDAGVTWLCTSVVLNITAQPG
jgi:cytoskeletal protein CcmA (bactofilin family)